VIAVFQEGDMGNEVGSRSGVRTAKVFGSAVIKVAPDVADVRVAVTRLEKAPGAAFASARKAAGAVGSYLNGLGLHEVGMSRVTMSQETWFTNGEKKLLGYKAAIGFHVVLRETARVDEVLTGVVEAGANELTAITFQTSRLAEVRADARRRAVGAARDKAELYATAVGAAVGRALAVEDVSPDRVTGRGESHMIAGGGAAAGSPDDGDDLRAIDPAAVAVAAAVTIVYELVEPR
jgi:uncharacterized protein YggE